MLGWTSKIITYDSGYGKKTYVSMEPLDPPPLLSEFKSHFGANADG